MSTAEWNAILAARRQAKTGGKTGGGNGAGGKAGGKGRYKLQCTDPQCTASTWQDESCCHVCYCSLLRNGMAKPLGKGNGKGQCLWACSNCSDKNLLKHSWCVKCGLSRCDSQTLDAQAAEKAKSMISADAAKDKGRGKGQQSGTGKGKDDVPPSPPPADTAEGFATVLSNKAKKRAAKRLRKAQELVANDAGQSDDSAMEVTSEYEALASVAVMNGYTSQLHSPQPRPLGWSSEAPCEDPEEDDANRAAMQVELAQAYQDLQAMEGMLARGALKSVDITSHRAKINSLEKATAAKTTSSGLSGVEVARLREAHAIWIRKETERGLVRERASEAQKATFQQLQDAQQGHIDYWVQLKAETDAAELIRQAA